MTDDWIEEEARKIEAGIAKAVQTETQMENIRRLVSQAWVTFNEELRRQIQDFNDNQTIQGKYKRKPEFNNDGSSSIKITSLTFPSIYMNVILSEERIVVEWKICTPKDSEHVNLIDRDVDESRNNENLNIVLGPENSLLIDGTNGRFGFEQLPEYILRKFLIAPTRFPRFPPFS